MSNIISGLAFLTINGRNIETEGQFSTDMGGSVLEGNKISPGGKVYFSETLTPGKITGSIIVVPGMDVNSIKAIRNQTIKVKSKAGQLYELRNASFTGSAVTDTKDGTMPVEFTGDPVKVI